jgi:hypothetical protein
MSPTKKKRPWRCQVHTLRQVTCMASLCTVALPASAFPSSGCQSGRVLGAAAPCHSAPQQCDGRQFRIALIAAASSCRDRPGQPSSIPSFAFSSFKSPCGSARRPPPGQRDPAVRRPDGPGFTARWRGHIAGSSVPRVGLYRTSAAIFKAIGVHSKLDIRARCRHGPLRCPRIRALC